MKFSPKVIITGISQDVFQTIRLCEAICASYRIEIFISYVNGPKGEFAISTSNMRGSMWNIMEDIVHFIDSNFVVQDKFTNVDKSPQILITKDK